MIEQHKIEFAFPNILMLATQSPVHLQRRFGFVVGLLAIAVELDQYLFFPDETRPGFITYAWLSDEASNLHETHQWDMTKTANWNCGKNFWVIDAIFPNGGMVRASRQLKKIKRTYFPEVDIVRWTRTHGTGRVQHIGSARI